jgi:hypothetical protein
MLKARASLLPAMLLVAASPPLIAVAAPRSPEGTVIAATFVDDRVYVDMPAPDGRAPVHLLTDSGGGSLLLSKAAASRLGLSLRPETNHDALEELGPDTQVGDATAFVTREWAGVPAHAQFTVIPETIPLKGWPAIGDGVLGRQWFGNHTWTWDYPHRQLILRPATWRPAADARSIEVAFKTDPDGHRVSDFARMTVRVDGEDLPVLFDTGATTILTPAALQALADGNAAMRATSMMAHKVIERWRARHPDWRVVEDAQLGTHSRMILAPEVEFAGRKTGPVWFTERSDKTYDEFMSPMMSDRIEGSIGGNVLGGVVISLDYRRSKAWVQ